MELRRLRYFRAVARLLNFTRAAERLRVAPPALSRQIRALESELGVVLFERNGGVKFTDAGRVFHAQTLKILAQVDLAVAAARETSAGDGMQLARQTWTGTTSEP
jgi:DNA-binding transcriptional LysR family regulator